MARYDIMKAEKIRQKIKQTKEKRKSQVPTIIQCKLQGEAPHLNEERRSPAACGGL